MSNFIKLHGNHHGVNRHISYSEEKTLYLRVSDIEEICVVPNGEQKYKKEITKKEYEENKDNLDYFINEGSSNNPDTYWKYLPTSMITMGHYGDNFEIGKNITLKVQAPAIDIVEMVDNSIVDFEVRKALAVEEALNPPKEK